MYCERRAQRKQLVHLEGLSLRLNNDLMSFFIFSRMNVDQANENLGVKESEGFCFYC